MKNLKKLGITLITKLWTLITLQKIIKNKG